MKFCLDLQTPEFYGNGDSQAAARDIMRFATRVHSHVVCSWPQNRGDSVQGRWPPEPGEFTRGSPQKALNLLLKSQCRRRQEKLDRGRSRSSKPWRMGAGMEGESGGKGRDQEVSRSSNWDLACGSVQKKPLEPRHVLRSIWSGVVSRHHEASFPGGRLQDLR